MERLWWYNSCHRSNLNGQYLSAGGKSVVGIRWQHWKLQRLKEEIRDENIGPAQF